MQTQILTEMLVQRLDEVLATLGVNLSEDRRFYYGACVHPDSDNPRALNIYKNTGYWQCNTMHCHNVFYSSILGFIRLVLSVRRGWYHKGDPVVPWSQVIGWAENFLQKKVGDLQIAEVELEKVQYARLINTAPPRVKKGGIISREEVRRRLRIPAESLIRRGFAACILDKYDVGTCENPAAVLHEHNIFPLYNGEAEPFQYVGCVARTLRPKCARCGLYHYGTCPETQAAKNAAYKWRNSKGLDVGGMFYNQWHAAREIRETGTAVLVEGALDCLRLIENGIQNVLGLMGCKLTDCQQIELERLGAMRLILALDNDESGRAGTKQIQEKCRRLFKLSVPIYDAEDVGDLRGEALQGLLKQLR